MNSHNFIDSHSHLADERWGDQLDQQIKEAHQWGITEFLQGGVDPEDWARQERLAELYPGRIGLCFGLHPYRVAAWEPEACEEALDQLARALPRARACGELGLDFRPHIMRDSRNRQIEMLQSQLEIAEVAAKPCVFHFVQCFEEAVLIFNEYGRPKYGGMVHSFNGSWAKAQEYLRRELLISVGGPLLHKKNQRLETVVKEIPLEFLALETDAPDQPPPEYQNQLNPLKSIWQVAEKVGSIRKMEPSEVLRISSSNVRRVFYRQ